MATAVEVACLFCVGLYATNIWQACLPLQATALGRALRDWLLFDANSISFALLIFVFAFQQGLISRLISKPVFAWLGHVSYALYLLHVVLLYLYHVNETKLPSMPPVVGVCAYCAITLLLSALTYSFVEKPWRRKLSGHFSGSGRAGFLVEKSVAQTLPEAINVAPFVGGLKGLGLLWLMSFFVDGPISQFTARQGGWAGLEVLLVCAGFQLTALVGKFRKALLACCLALAASLGWKAWLLFHGASHERIVYGVDTNVDAVIFGWLAASRSA
jgi:peptidoglycan/LPS O-acetylase OafA/YrhL